MFPSFRNAIAGPSRLPSAPLPLLRARARAAPLALARAATLPQMISATASPLGLSRLFSSSSAAQTKLKSHSGTKKRFFRTGGGLADEQFKRGQAGKRHLNTLFSASRINKLGRTAYATKTQSKMLEKLLPYA